MKNKQNGIVDTIRQTDWPELDAIMKAVIRRYGELFPEWELYFISMHRDAEKRKKDLEDLIYFLERLEEHRKSEGIGK